MGHQLGLFDGCEGPAPAPTPAVEPPEPPLPDLGADPGQTDLFAGPYRERHEAELACERLDAVALRAAHASARRRYPTWAPARDWSAWADSLEQLADVSGFDAQAERALALADGAAAARVFPGMPRALVATVRREALARAARAAVAARGAAARATGRPAGALLLAADPPEEATAALEAAAAAAPADAEFRFLLGTSYWRSGRATEALAAWRDACLLDPASVDERDLPAAATDLLDLAADLDDLPGDPAAWLPVFADLTGAAPLPGWAVEAPDDAPPARRFAALLRAYRDAQARSEGDEARSALKRAMLRLAPPLRERIRRL